MRAIPRPLLILVAIVVVLGVFSCGAAGLKGEPNPSDASWDFKPEGIPIFSEVPDGVGCEKEGTVIKVADTCTLSIEAQTFPPRELRFHVLAGTPRVIVTQQVGDNIEQIDKDFKPGATFDVSVSGDDSIAIKILCASAALAAPCRLEVLED